MSRKPYECYYCRDHGFPNMMVYLAGKDENNRTIQLEEDGSKHIHKVKQQQPSEYEQSVERGISAFSMVSDLIVLVEQTQKLLVAMDEKLDKLLINLAELKK
jgi:hypothetical protein